MLSVTEVADGVFRARTSDLVSWYLVLDGDAVLLVDAGYPADSPAVVASLGAIGRRGPDVVAMLVTHAHADHLGGITGLQDDGTLDLPGSPTPLPTAGHTEGRTAVHRGRRGVLLTGDTLVTGHPMSRRAGPQPLPASFDRDRAGAMASLAVLGAVEADVVLPGHGEPYRGDAAAAVEGVRRRGG